MKKLSFIIAIIMILTYIPIVAAPAVTAADSDPDPVVDLTIPSGTTVNQNASIGYVLDNNAKVYVGTLTNAAEIASANIGKQVILYLTKDYTTANRIGYVDSNNPTGYDQIDLTNGADLVIDGQSKYSMKSTNDRFIHFDSGKGTGQITFRNMTIGNAPLANGTYAEGSMQTNEDSLQKITLKNVTIDIPKPRASSSIVISTDAEFDGVIRDCINEGFVFVNTDSGISLTIKNSTIDKALYVINGNGNTIKKISIDGMKVTNLGSYAFQNCTFESGDDTGMFIHNANITCTRPLFYSNVSGNVVINGGTFINNNSSADNDEMNLKHLIYLPSSSSNVNFTINGGTFSSTNGHVIMFSGSNGNSSTITINGGTFTTQSAGHATLYQSFNDGNKTFTINGGTFNSWNKKLAADKDTINGSDPTVYGVLYSSADTFNVNGGTFNLYSDAGSTLATVGMHAISRGAGYININGGTFNGGKDLYIKSDTTTYELSKKVAMPKEGGTYSLTNSAIKTTVGASVRTVSGSPGLRFQGTVSKDVINYVKALSGATNVYCGIAIIPASFLDSTDGIFTFDALEAAAKNDTSIKWATTNATTGLIESADKTYYTVRLSLTGIEEANYNKEFVAITYVYGDLNANSSTVSTSDIVVYSSNYSEPRSLVNTAKAALADVMATSGTYNGRAYTTVVTTDGYYYRRKLDGTFEKTTLKADEKVYSPFTTAQLDILKIYAKD